MWPRRDKALLVAAAVVLAACSGKSSPSGPSTPAIPQIAGTYSGPTTDSTINPPQQVQTWQIRSYRAGETSPRFRNCAGTLTIQQSGSSLTGSFSQVDSCGDVAGVVTGGAVRSDGGVTMSLSGPASDPLAWTGFAHCTLAISGTMDLTGSVNAGLLNASFAHDALIQCPAEGSVSVNVQVRGTR